MRASSACRCLILYALIGVPSLAAQDRDDAAWQRECEREHDRDDGERYCDVRHTGFRPTGSSLTIDPDENGGVEVIGWDRDSVAITLRIQATARDEADARSMAEKVEVEATGSRVRLHGPSTGRREHWSASLVVRVPRRTGLYAATVNGPLRASNLSGNIELRSTNGPLSLSRLAGEVRARVQNGSLSVELSGSTWDGKGLDAESVNGPVDLGIPDGYNAELETGTVNGPMDTRIPLTITVRGRMRDRIQTTLGKGGSPVRVVTTNGPITIHRAPR
jgi:DUF4097 and DUF4098 domain-containing protein YvlB